METARSRTHQLLFSTGGPAALGVLLGLSRGIRATALGAAELPLIVIGVLLLMIPALYIGAALTGVDLAIGRVVDAASAALSRAGLVILGLVPALLFLLISTEDPAGIRVAASLALVVATLVGAPALYAGLGQPGHRFLFSCWSLVGLGIAGSLYVNAFLT